METGPTGHPFMLAKKLTLVLSGVVLVTAALLGVVWSREITHELEHNKLARLHALAATTRVAVEYMLQTGSLEDLQRMVTQLAESHEIDAVVVVNEQGRPMIEPEARLPGRLWAQLRGGHGGGDLWLADHLERARVLPLTAYDGSPVGRLAVVQDWSDIGRSEHKALVRATELGLALAIVVTLVLWGAVRTVVARPIEQVSAAVAAIAGGDMGETARVTLTQQDEIGELGRAINRMREELERARAALLREHDRSLRMERSLHTSERMAATGQLAAGIAHEIGTALNIVQGRAQLLLESGLAAQTASAGLTVIVDQCSRISATVRRLLDFARTHETKLERADLNALVRASFDLVEPGFKRIDAVLELAPSPLWVCVDRRLLSDVVVNLAVNAIQAMGDGGGRLVMGTAATDASPGGREGRFAIVYVADSGPGVAPENVARIFEPFFTTKAPGEGTGLGLSISYKIVADLGGEMEVERGPDGGALFRVVLPRADDPDAGSESEGSGGA